ncbi:MAG: sugar phosphate isomerase/epimerase family protein [Candidatus Poribacteria bacterium]
MIRKIGLHICGWGERPLPDLLIAARELGYDGVELAPTWLEKSYNLADVDEMLREHRVSTVPAVCAGGSNYCDPKAIPDAVEMAKNFCQWIKQRGGQNVIFFPAAGRGGRRTPDEERNVYRAYEAIADAVLSEGCMPLYHNHYRVSHDVSRQILESDLENMDWKKWRLCFDTGHLVLALQDPVAMFRDWAEVVKWVHFKDVRTARFSDTSAPNPSVQKFFTELGRGVVDFPRIVEILGKANYTGWFVVEQDYSDLTPYESARISLEYLRTIMEDER